MMAMKRLGWMLYRMNEKETRSIMDVTIVMNSCRLKAVNDRTSSAMR